MWLALRLTPLGIALAALWPEYRIPALHVTFIGGFGLMAFAVASHVAYGHLGLESLRDGRPAAVVLAGGGIVLAMLARLAADLERHLLHASRAGRRVRGWWVRAGGLPISDHDS